MSLVVPAERKLDYLSFTLPRVNSPYEVYPLLGLQFEERGFGLNRYKNSAQAVAGGAMVLWEGCVPGMGVHVQISGQGLRLIEAQDGFPGWQTWVGIWLDKGAKFARFDMAFDDLGGRIAFETVVSQLRTRTAVTRAHGFQVIENVDYDKGTANTLYVGKRTSETLMRCYDKGMQLGEDHSWLRFEFEYKKKRADAIARIFVDFGWDLAAGVARSFIEFKDETHITTDRSRQRPAEWWVELIDASKHILRISKDAHSSLIKSWSWLKRQVAPVIGVMMEHEGGDISWVCELADEGRRRFHERHYQMLRDNGELPPLGEVHG